MRVLVQKSKQSSVTVSGKVVGKISSGLVLFVGFTHEDTYIDEETYKYGYTRRYKIVTYDRLLNNSKESSEKSF